MLNFLWRYSYDAVRGKRQKKSTILIGELCDRRGHVSLNVPNVQGYQSISMDIYDNDASGMVLQKFELYFIHLAISAFDRLLCLILAYLGLLFISIVGGILYHLL